MLPESIQEVPDSDNDCNNSDYIEIINHDFTII